MVQLTISSDIAVRALEHVRNIAVSRRPKALDICGGSWELAMQLVRAGASVTAADHKPYGRDLIDASSSTDAGPEDLMYICMKLTDIPATLTNSPFDVITCHNAIHFVQYDKARQVLRTLAANLASDGKIFLLAAGIGSELARGYAPCGYPVHKRFAVLEEDTSIRHKIYAPVCLYSQSDLTQLLEDAGLHTDYINTLPSGNIQAIASQQPREPVNPAARG